MQTTEEAHRTRRSSGAGRRWLRRTAVATAAVGALTASGVAFAAWNVVGTGSGAADAASALELVIEDFELDAALYPGLTTGATLTVTNPNLFPVNITDIVFGTLVISDGGPGCTINDSEVLFEDVTEVELFLAANTEDIELELSAIVSMGPGADDDCQGAKFTAPISLTAESTTE